MLDLIIAKNSGESVDSNGSAIVGEQQMIEHFGEMYALKPNDFRFQLGDRKFIKLIIQTITNTIEKKGRKKAMQHFGYKDKLPRKKNIKCNKNEHTAKMDLQMDSNTNDSHSEKIMRAKLIKQISNKLKELAVPHHFIDMFNESFVTFETRENTIVNAGVICVVCHAKNVQSKKLKPYNVHCRNKSGRLSWIISNFTKHFRRAHPSMDDCMDDCKE